MIPVDRSGGPAALKKMIKDVKAVINDKRSVIIFPEGTRTIPGQKKKYNPGIGIIHKEIDVPIIPVALNSGLFWGKNSFTKKPGKIILPAIKQKMDTKEFIKTLQKNIENGVQAL